MCQDVFLTLFRCANPDVNVIEIVIIGYRVNIRSLS